MTSIKKFKKELKKDTYSVSTRLGLAFTWNGKCFRKVFSLPQTCWVYIYATCNSKALYDKNYYIIKRAIQLKMKPHQSKHYPQYYHDCEQPDETFEPSFYAYIRSRFNKKSKHHKNNNHV